MGGLNTEERSKRILLVSDYSNFHATLAKGLRSLGADVTLLGDGGSFMQCERDIDISRRHPTSKLEGLRYAASFYYTFLRKLRGYDIVSFRDPLFLDLKPQKVKWFFKQLVGANKNCFLTYLSTDVPFLDMLEAHDSPLSYSEWFIEGKPNRLRIEDENQWNAWHTPQMKDLNDYFYSKIKGIVTALYEYQVSAERIFPKEKVAYGGIPLDLDSIKPQIIEKPKKLRIFLGRDYRRKLQKGSDLLEIAARNVVDRHPDKAELILIENLPHDKYMEIMRSCHILLDQMYAYTPSTMALEGMASGLTVVSGGEKDYYRFIGELENFPVVNSPIYLEPLEKCLENLVSHPEDLRERSIKGREFVEKHNHYKVVAKRFLDFWTKNA